MRPAASAARFSSSSETLRYVPSCGTCVRCTGSMRGILPLLLRRGCEGQPQGRPQYLRGVFCGSKPCAACSHPTPFSGPSETPQSRREPEERIRRPREPAAEVIGNDDVVATKIFDHLVQVLCSPLRTSNAVLEGAPSLRSLGESLKNPSPQGCEVRLLLDQHELPRVFDFKTSKPPSGMMLQIQSLMRSRPLSWFVR